MEVIKRNGIVVQFNKTKIRQAITKAMKLGSGIYLPDIARLISNDAERYFSKKGETPSIGMIEAYVYQRLNHYGQNETARAYEGFRAVQEFKRETNTIDDSVMGLIQSTNEEVATENSNKDSNIVSTQRDLIAGEVSKDIARRKLIPAHLIQANDSGIIKIHDLDYYMNGIYNCELLNLDDMLQNGTVINKKFIRKPKSLRTAMTIATQISAQVSSSTYGGQTMSLTHLAPFVRISKNKISSKYEHLRDIVSDKIVNEIINNELKEEIKDSVQTFNYQINTISGTNGQLAV